MTKLESAHITEFLFSGGGVITTPLAFSHIHMIEESKAITSYQGKENDTDKHTP